MQRIADSELIINSRGAIYHLDLRPEEIAHTIFTVGDPARVHQISKYFDKMEFQAAHREFFHTQATLVKKEFQWFHRESVRITSTS